MTKCPQCPVASDYCRGFSVPRFCELIDQACPQFDPAYMLVIVQETDRHIRSKNGEPLTPMPSRPCCPGGDLSAPITDH
jgi:hypothetical protein